MTKDEYIAELRQRLSEMTDLVEAIQAEVARMQLAAPRQIDTARALVNEEPSDR